MSEPGGADAPGPADRWVTDGPLDPDALARETADEESGALVVFCGTVRAHNRGRRVEGLTYEAHEELATRVLRELEEEVLRDFDVRRCRLQHRVGELELGEASVAVVVRAAHRDQAFAAARHAIDELKERIPVWKEEHYADGESVHLDGTPLEAD